jgi:hypothetical protein
MRSAFPPYGIAIARSAPRDAAISRQVHIPIEIAAPPLGGSQ